MGARAAGQARNGRLARSAPSEGPGPLVKGDKTGVDNEPRSLEESHLLDEPISTVSPSSAAEWIKVLDLIPSSSRSNPNVVPTKVSACAPSPSSSSRLASPALMEAEVIAHFRLPSNHSLTSSLASKPPSLARRASDLRSPSIALLSFSPSGTQLFAAPSDGRASHIVDIHPAGALKQVSRLECVGEAWHLFELKRGTTSASVCEVSWDKGGRWIGVGTGLGTVRECSETSICTVTYVVCRCLSHHAIR